MGFSYWFAFGNLIEQNYCLNTTFQGCKMDILMG